MRNKPLYIRKNERGDITVDQHIIGKYIVTYNPDDERFYVNKLNDDGSIDWNCVKTFKRYRNAIYCVRKINELMDWWSKNVWRENGFIYDTTKWGW